MSKVPPSQEKIILTHLDWNLQRLDEVLKQGNTDYFKSAALQRFGHAYTMVIKCLRHFIKIENQTDVECMALAIKNNWTENPSLWEEMVVDFKQINNKPSEQEAEAIYQKLSLYQQAFKSLLARLQKIY
jgi:hypothetical protein